MKENARLQFSVEEWLISENINNFIDKNSIEESFESIEDLEEIISKTEKFRSVYRSKSEELKSILSYE